MGTEDRTEHLQRTELPVSIDTRWFVTYTSRPFRDHDDYLYVITWADGSTEERHTIPREWNAIAHATHLAKIEAAKPEVDALLAKMAGEHAEGRVGDTPILKPVTSPAAALAVVASNIALDKTARLAVEGEQMAEVA